MCKNKMIFPISTGAFAKSPKGENTIIFTPNKKIADVCYIREICEIMDLQMKRNIQYLLNFDGQRVTILNLIGIDQKIQIIIFLKGNKVGLIGLAIYFQSYIR
jgi:hypothetical protein